MTLFAYIPSFNFHICYFILYTCYARLYARVRDPVFLDWNGMLTIYFLIRIFPLHMIRFVKAVLVIFRGIAELSQIESGKLLVPPHHRHGTCALHHLHHNREVWVAQISLVRRLHGSE